MPESHIDYMINPSISNACHDYCIYSVRYVVIASLMQEKQTILNNTLGSKYVVTVGQSYNATISIVSVLYTSCKIWINSFYILD